jgi:hypothetical protein
VGGEGGGGGGLKKNVVFCYLGTLLTILQNVTMYLVGMTGPSVSIAYGTQQTALDALRPRKRAACAQQTWRWVKTKITLSLSMSRRRECCVVVISSSS